MQISAEESEESAEINARIDGIIPSIKVSEWTSIDIIIKDAFGINWDFLRQTIPEWWMRFFWPLNPAFPQPVERFLGYTNFKLSIPQNELPDGWLARVVPSFINQSNTGNEHPVTLQVQVDDSAVDSQVTIPLKCTRIDTLGGEIGYSYIYIPLKPSPTNFITPLKTDISQKEAGPKTMVYFNLDIINEGYYKDVFQFDVETENELLGLIDQQAITLEPGETSQISLSILTPETFFDPGTPNLVKIYVYSSGNDTKTLISTLTVITRGVYISPLVLIIAIPIILIVIFLYIVFIRIKDKKIIEKFGKIDKPWNITEEKKYLQNLKEKDKEEYIKTIDMMKDEYKSSMLWYKDYIKNKKIQKSDKTSSSETIKNFFNNQKNNIKNIRKPKKKKEDKEIIEEKIEEEKSTKDEKNLYNKISSIIPRRKQSKKEKYLEGKKSIENETNETTLSDLEIKNDKLLIDKNEEEKKTKRAKTLEIKKNREKEKTISKIKKIQERQKRKIK
jgi:uncharacterized membrane protein